jgi:hypothetical protein
VNDRIMLDGMGTDSAAIFDAIAAHRSWGGIRASMGAGYGDGSISAWTSAEWVALTDIAQPVTVTVTGEPGRNVADIENGNMTPASGAAWAHAEHLAGRYPVLYVNRSNKAAVVDACTSWGLGLGALYGLWVATLDGTFMDGTADLRNEPGMVAVQYLSAAGTTVGPHADGSGGQFDVSLVVDSFWLPVPEPPAAWQAEALKQALALAGAATDLITLLGAHQ